MATVFNGQVQGLSKVTIGTPNVPVAFCREVIGGNLIVRSHDTAEAGIGGQWHSRKGTLEAELSWRCIGVADTDMAFWFPTTAGVQVASFPDFIVEADDGTHGKEWLLEDGQPGTCRISITEAPDAQLILEFMAKFATPSQQNVATNAAVYNSTLGYTINDIKVEFGAAVNKGCLSFDLSNDLGVAMNNPMDGKVEAVKTLPDGYLISPTAPPAFRCVTSDMYQGEAADILADTWTPLDIIITLDNGVAEEDITITLDDYKPAGDAFNMPLEAAGKVGFGHAFEAGSGTMYNRVQFG